jgi:hypothetical protein
MCHLSHIFRLLSMAFAFQALVFAQSSKLIISLKITVYITVWDEHKDPVEGVVLHDTESGSRTQVTDDAGNTEILLVNAPSKDRLCFQLVKGIKANWDWSMAEDMCVNVQKRSSSDPHAPPQFVAYVYLKKKPPQQLLKPQSLVGSDSNEVSRFVGKGGEPGKKEAEPVRDVETVTRETSENSRYEEEVALFRLKRYQDVVDNCRLILLGRRDDDRIHYILGLALSRLESYDDALLHLSQCWQIRVNQSGEEDADVANVMESYASVLRKKNQESEAREIDERVKRIREKLVQRSKKR